MEYDKNTNEIFEKEIKSEVNSRDLSRNIISTNSAIQLTKDLNIRRGKMKANHLLKFF